MNSFPSNSQIHNQNINQMMLDNFELENRIFSINNKNINYKSYACDSSDFNMSKKLYADYVELANQYLDNIQIKNEENLKHIKIALAILLVHNDLEIENNLDDRIKSIKWMLDNPDLYASVGNHGTFRKIIRSRIASKIEEIQSLTEEEIKKYIELQETSKKVAQKNQELLIQAKMPEINSEAHTISEQQFLEERQREFNEEIRQQIQANNQQRASNNWHNPEETDSSSDDEYHPAADAEVDYYGTDYEGLLGMY
jgi:hypothetical protein